MAIEKIRENLYVKKTGNTYRIIYPLKNEDGSINWKNLILGGSWGNFISVVFFVSLLIFALWAYAYDTKACRELLENPPSCGYVVGGKLYSDIKELEKFNMSVLFPEEDDNEFNLSLFTQNNDSVN